MALTVTNKTTSVWGDRMVLMCDVAFDSSYAFGGESFNYSVMGFDHVDRVIIEPVQGYHFAYDYTNKTIKVLHNAPPIVVEEQQTIASNAITLRYPPAYIMAVAQSATNVKLTTSGATVGANECQPTAVFTWGAQGGLTFHSGLSGVVYVSYVTQAWKEVWDNLVQEEAVTPESHIGTLTYDAIAIQAINASAGGTTTNSCLMIDKDDTPATTECSVDFSDSAAVTLTFATADAVTAAVCTYIKLPSSGFLKDNWVEEEAMTATSNVCTPAYPILLWGYSGQLLENAAVTGRIINIGGSAGSEEGYINFNDPYTKITQDAVTTGTAAYVKGRRGDIPTVPIECHTGLSLSDLSTVKVTVLGW